MKYYLSENNYSCFSHEPSSKHQHDAITTGSSGTSTSFGITSEGLPVLEALTIVTRSLHNCRVFGYYSGIQKLTALMKGIVYVIIFSAFFFKVYLSNKFFFQVLVLFVCNIVQWCYNLRLFLSRSGNMWICSILSPIALVLSN